MENTLSKNGSTNSPSYVATNSTNNGDNLVMSNTVDSSAKWELLKYTGEDMYSLLYTKYTDELLTGEEFKFKAYMYSTVIGHNGPVIYSVSSTTGATTSNASIDCDTGSVIALKEGEFKVRATYAGAPWLWTLTIKTDSWNVLVDGMQELYLYAQGYAPNSSRATYAYYVLSFIRNNSNYRYNPSKPSSALWNITTGDSSLYSNYIEYVNQRNTQLSTLYNGNRNYYILDGNGDRIDFYHLIATLNGMLFVQLYPEKIAELGMNLAGWAGDLQSLVPDVMGYLDRQDLPHSYYNIYNRVRACLSNPDPSSSRFSELDFLADIDAYNLYELILNMQTDSFSTYFTYYYTYNYRQRCSLFTDTATYDELYDWVHKYISMPLVLGSFQSLTSTQKRAFATAFSDHLWEYAEA